jgi:hypothetical protein
MLKKVEKFMQKPATQFHFPSHQGKFFDAQLKSVERGYGFRTIDQSVPENEASSLKSYNSDY